MVAEKTMHTSWRTQFNRQQSLYQNKFINHWSEKINSSSGNGKVLWAHLNCLLTRPKISATTHSANSFADHFTQKIRRIWHSTSGYSTPNRSADVPLATFRPVSADEVEALIKKSPAKQCPLQHHSFADDTQMYVGSIQSQVHIFASFRVHCWCQWLVRLTATAAEQYQDRTHMVRYIILVAWSVAIDKSLAVSDVNLQPVESVHNLGVYFNSELSMKAHVSKTALVCFFQFRRLCQIRRLLGRDVTSNLVTALVFLHLNYSNALLAGLPHTTLAPLQRVINATVYLVDGLWPWDHVKVAAMALHWLPVEAQIQYKLCLLVHLAMARKAPTYITSVLQPITACPWSMVPRSATDDELFTPRSRLKFSERAFRISAPKAWTVYPTTSDWKPAQTAINKN